MRKKAGQYFFEYHCWESENSQDAELWHHTKQVCTILKEVDGLDDADKEALGGTMYHVQFDDGFEHDVFNDELLRKVE